MKNIITTLLLFCALPGFTQVPSWKYIQVDDNRAKWGDFDKPDWLRYFGLGMEDMNHDGYRDIVAGRYIYINPGGDLTDDWQRIDLGMNVDGMLITDIDGDEYADIIAEALPDVWWMEASDTKATEWKGKIIANIPATDHVNGQGYKLADIIAGGKKEILLSATGGIYACKIPEDPSSKAWDFRLICETNSEEGMGAGDLDGDGDIDIAAGFIPGGETEPVELRWFENPGDISQKWAFHTAGRIKHAVDRVVIADFDMDGKNDIAVTEELYPGLEPDASIYWFRNQGGSFSRTTLFTGYSLNNLGVADADLDGDPDIVTNEHKGKEHKNILFTNDGKGHFEMTVFDTGKESHLGTKFADMDNDGDPDLVSAAWDNYKYLHLWRNDKIQKNLEWKHLSTATGDLEVPNPGNQQTSSLMTDIDKDGLPELFVTERTSAPAVVMYKKQGDKWERYIIEPDTLFIEAGSAHYDIDGDGDEDIVFGGESKSNQVWWWENPWPDIRPGKPWKRFTIKNSGATKHHDQMFGDFDGDGRSELVFWNQNAGTLFMAKIPDRPKKTAEWERTAVYRYSTDSQMMQTGQEGYPGWKGVNEHEGLAAADVDGDGLMDIIGGGRWFKYTGNGKFIENIIDASYTFTRAAAGQFIEGGRPEIILVAGDGIAPMYMYSFDKGTWERKLLIPEVHNGHTIDVIDFDHDGHLDIFSAEMGLGDIKEPETRILFGDGMGNFTDKVIIRGFANHESRIGDLDGDGDFDIFGKPYTWKAPRIDLWINVTGEQK